MTAKLCVALFLASTLAAQVQLQEVKKAKVQSPQSQPASRPSKGAAPKKSGRKFFKQPVQKWAPGVGKFQFSGAPFSDKKISAISAGKLLKKFKELKGKMVRVYGKVEQTCSKKGCWMWVRDIKDPTQKIWVRFKDYGFFVPKKGVEGHLVVMEGSAKEVTFSVKTARHIKEDAGDLEGAKKITKPVKMVQLTATSVMILARKNPPKGSKSSSRPNQKKNSKEEEMEEREEAVEEEAPAKKKK